MGYKKGWSVKEGRVVHTTTLERRRQMNRYTKKWIKRNVIGEDLTEREKQVLYLIRIVQQEELFSPTVTDIARTFYIPIKNANYYVQRLEEKGYIQTSGTRRGLRILFPKGTALPWGDRKQFPDNIFMDEAFYKKRFNL